MWVAHARRWKSPSGSTFAAGSHGELLTGAVRILISPWLTTVPTSGLLVKSLVTENVRRPSGVVRQPQHSSICWSLSNTYTMAQRLPLDVPGLVTRTVASGAPETPLLAK